MRSSLLVIHLTQLLIIKTSIVLGNSLEAIDLSQFALILNDTSCGDSSCPMFDISDPPPDAILLMPPPPLPPFLQTALAENESFRDNENCNLCHIFHDPSNFDSEIMLPKPAVKTSDSWLSVLVATILGSTVFGALFLVFLFKCKKYFIFFLRYFIIFDNSFCF